MKIRHFAWVLIGVHGYAWVVMGTTEISDEFNTVS
jgi:hypothetical protein